MNFSHERILIGAESSRGCEPTVRNEKFFYQSSADRSNRDVLQRFDLAREVLVIAIDVSTDVRGVK